MAVWAYPCKLCGGGSDEYFVPVELLAEMPPDTRILRIRVGGQWRCATLDRGHKVSVERMLIREAVASNEIDCPECKPVGAHQVDTDAESDRGAAGSPSRTVQAAAIALQDTRMVVVLVSMDLLQSTGEADMAIESLEASFAGTPVVLLAQHEDGTPRYHGEATLVALLEGVPIEHMPWKVYPVR